MKYCSFPVQNRTMWISRALNFDNNQTLSHGDENFYNSNEPNYGTVPHPEFLLYSIFAQDIIHVTIKLYMLIYF